MSGVAEQRGAARRLSSRRRASAVIIALTAAVAFGAIDQYLGTLSSWSLTEVSGMSAPWLLLPFLAGAWQTGQRRAAVVALAATWLAVLAYVAMIVSPMEGVHLGPRPAALAAHSSWVQLSPRLVLASLASQGLWFAGGLITGPLYGFLGYRWLASHSRAAALLAALPVLLEPAARLLAARFGHAYLAFLAYQWRGLSSASIAEVGVGLVLTAVVVTAMVRGRSLPSA
jgi:hypothetical protein